MGDERTPPPGGVLFLRHLPTSTGSASSCDACTLCPAELIPTSRQKHLTTTPRTAKTNPNRATTNKTNRPTQTNKPTPPSCCSWPCCSRASPSRASPSSCSTTSARYWKTPYASRVRRRWGCSPAGLCCFCLLWFACLFLRFFFFFLLLWLAL